MVSEFRSNEVGIQMLSKNIYTQLFPKLQPEMLPHQAQIQYARDLLTTFNLLGKQQSPLPEVTLPLPKLLGDNLDDHFQILGREQAGPCLEKAHAFANAKLPEKPKVFSENAGWTKYSCDGDGSSIETIVEYPEEDLVVFDVETMYHHSHYPILATAVSEKHWYSWVSPELAELLQQRHQNQEIPPDEVDFSTLIPMGWKPKVIIGHNVAYDRARIKEEYSVHWKDNMFLDTMSMHNAVGGLSSQQRGLWLSRKKRNEMIIEEIRDEVMESGEIGPSLREKMEREEHAIMQDRWLFEGSMSNLADVAKQYLNEDVSKEDRDLLATDDVNDILDNFQRIMRYCAEDVRVTSALFAKLLPRFLEKNPHLISFAGMLEMGKGFLPTNKAWDDYVESAEKMCTEEVERIEARLLELAERVLPMAEDGSWRKDPWLKHLNWQLTTTKSKILPHHPKWYRELWDSEEQRVLITVKKRVVPYLLGLSWRGYPLFWYKKYGWIYQVPFDQAGGIKDPEVTVSLSQEADDDDEEPVKMKYFKIPHKDGEDGNCGNPLVKFYLKPLESGLMESKHKDLAIDVIKVSVLCSYWISARERVQSQMVVNPLEHFTPQDLQLRNSTTGHPIQVPERVILPKTVVMGTVTRRAVEPTWMTAANAKENRIGSELKSQIQAPGGYIFIGADVDSEELWICSLMGDSQFRIHGATPLGFMTLQGSKAQGNDLHSHTGKIMGIKRDNAKVFNYSRMYGAGLKHSVQLLMQNSPGIDKKEAQEKVNALFKETKGVKVRKRGGDSYWHGGTESFMFNVLERMAKSDKPTTPVLQCVIPETLLPKNVKHDYMTCRVNWAVQSSGVDYLHLLLVSMNYLFRRMKIEGRFMLSIHDEVRFLVKQEHAELATLALQISNMWTRALFAYRVGIQDLPLNVAFFSAVDIDHCLRKEVDMDCVTPSNPTPITKGEKRDIYETMQAITSLCGNGDLETIYSEELDSVKQVRDKYIQRKALLQSTGALKKGADRAPDIDWLKAQMPRTEEKKSGTTKKKEKVVAFLDGSEKTTASKLIQTTKANQPDSTFEAVAVLSTLPTVSSTSTVSDSTTGANESTQVDTKTAKSGTTKASSSSKTKRAEIPNEKPEIVSTFMRESAESFPIASNFAGANNSVKSSAFDGNEDLYNIKVVTPIANSDEVSERNDQRNNEIRVTSAPVVTTTSRSSEPLPFKSVATVAAPRVEKSSSKLGKGKSVGALKMRELFGKSRSEAASPAASTSSSRESAKVTIDDNDQVDGIGAVTAKLPVKADRKKYPIFKKHTDIREM
ncbi:hypothetical protein HDU76_005892 [Blyttiomyces sp. JEL0837]|nr:hypothetical protein HDU76_005892 [Blyttiomyces sp. JEL0837]